MGLMKRSQGSPLPALGIADALFSRVQMRLLGIFFGHPDRDFQGAELIRMAASGVGAVYRELGRLVSSGLVKVTPVGRQKLYRANRESPVFDELHGLVKKTVGLMIPISEVLSDFADEIRAAFVYGSMADGTDTADSDVDLLIVGGKLTYPEILTSLQPLEEKLQRSISLNLFSPAEWKRKLDEENAFVLRVLSRPKLFVIGSEDDLS